jgi:hypothetical protein
MIQRNWPNYYNIVIILLALYSISKPCEFVSRQKTPSFFYDSKKTVLLAGTIVDFVITPPDTVYDTIDIRNYIESKVLITDTTKEQKKVLLSQVITKLTHSRLLANGIILQEDSLIRILRLKQHAVAYIIKPIEIFCKPSDITIISFDEIGISKSCERSPLIVPRQDYLGRKVILGGSAYINNKNNSANVSISFGNSMSFLIDFKNSDLINFTLHSNYKKLVNKPDSLLNFDIEIIKDLVRLDSQNSLRKK